MRRELFSIRAGYSKHLLQFKIIDSTMYFKVQRCLLWITAFTTFLLISSRRAVEKFSKAEEFSLDSWQDLNSSNFTAYNRRLSDVSRESHSVKSLPGLSAADAAKIKQYAGHIEVDNSRGSNIFYWLFESKKNAADTPLIIWLNGGPGCSSMDGLWLELGPFRLSGDKVSLNPHSWHNVGHLLFVDQPVGTGLSYTLKKDGYAKNDAMINAAFYKFLQKFFALHPQLVSSDGNMRTTTKIIFTGESHAGHYIPSMTDYILNQNEDVRTGKSNNIVLRIDGLALGNPWIDPYNQYDVSELGHGLGLVSIGQMYKLKEQEQNCRRFLNQKSYNQRTCFSLLDGVVDASATGGSLKVLMYDARRFVPNPHVFPPGHEALERYLNRPEVRKAINAAHTPHRYVECADPPFYALIHQDGVGVTKELARVLNADVRVLIYSGQFDLVCNHISTEKALYQLEWKGLSGWQSAERAVWLASNKPSGYLTSYNNLQSLLGKCITDLLDASRFQLYFLVLDSGHMVPLDQPKIALEMIDRFVNSQPLSNGKSRVGISTNIKQNCLDFSGNNRSLSSALEKPRVHRLRGKLQVHDRLLQNEDFDKSDASMSTNYSSSRRLDRTYALRTHSSTITMAHVLPLDGAALVKLRFTSRRTENQASNYHNLTGMFIIVEPGNRKIPLHEDHHHLHGFDFTIHNLDNGLSYNFVLAQEVQSADGSAFISLSHRHVSVIPGCFRLNFTQCCGNGECVADSAAGVCECANGYSGMHCDHYSVVIDGVTQNVSSTMSCSSHIAHLQNMPMHNSFDPKHHSYVKQKVSEG